MRKIPALATALVALGLAACQPISQSQEEELGSGAAFVDAVEVEERNGEFWAVLHGSYPDACSTFGGSRQDVEGDIIQLTIASTRPEDLACAQVLTEMMEEILLDTDDLDPGEYIVIVNDGPSATFLIS